ncbi:hypothetical protein H9P43_001828 [Blastocladiella emersonii ATCC 22665]|nr:hypothetical protein H9P43_001828 [Blastocladiella emersonii ATCC 22665]
MSGNREAFLSAAPKYQGRRKSVHADFKRRDMKALFVELASALVRADVGDPKKWGMLREWACGELPLDAASYFDIARSGAPKPVQCDPFGDYDDSDAESLSVDEAPAPPSRGHAVAALGVVLQWRNRNGKLMYTTFAEQIGSKLTLAPISPALANPAIRSKTRRAILRVQAKARRFDLEDEDTDALVSATILEGATFTLEIMCHAIREFRTRSFL